MLVGVSGSLGIEVEWSRVSGALGGAGLCRALLKNPKK